MSRTDKAHSIIRETVEEVLGSALPRLQEEMVGRIMQEMRALDPSPGSTPPDLLNAASEAIQNSATQAEILRNLLEGAARFAGRAALFVVKSGAGQGWQATGFDGNDEIKSVSLGGPSGLFSDAVQGREPIAGLVTDFDSGFASVMGAPADGQCVLLPLVVREKTAAVLYVDSGVVPGAETDVACLTTLCRFTGIWLELTALRKSGLSAPPEEGAETQGAAAHVPVPYAPPDSATPEDELHRKAKRFAKLLVDEIKLYNQARVAEGRQNRDLYGRLRDDIEKSRATYDKRYSETPAAEANYFNYELVRILADNDVTLMGEGFPG